MTERLYYTDPYATRFSAHVIETLSYDDHPAVILDRSAFYPTSGGQPADRGCLGNATVLDVVEREADGALVHVLSDPLTGREVQGEIAWERRFDHMQQHTGQHVLSAAFERMLGASTVGFHLGAEASTIDLDVQDLELEQILPIEVFANRVVWDNRAVEIRLVDEDSFEDMATNAPPDVEGPIRLIQIRGTSSSYNSDFDVNPCGGTHVSHTGEIGLIKIVGLEHRGDKTRIEFLCGGRALHDYEARRRITSILANRLTVGTSELNEAVERLQDENKELRHSERALRERLLDMESDQLAERAVACGPYRVVGTVYQGRNPDELRTLARKAADHRNIVILLFSVNDRTHFCFARDETLDLDVNQLLQEACAQLDGKGGGRPEVAQGSAPPADADEVTHVLRRLQASLERGEREAE